MSCHSRSYLLNTTPQSADSLAAASLSASGRGSLAPAARSAGSYKSDVYLRYQPLVVFVGF